MANAHAARSPRDERGEVDPRSRAALAGGGGCLARPRATRWVGGWWSQQGHDRRPRFVYHPARADEVAPPDRKSVVEGKRGAVRVDLGGGRIIKKKKKKNKK